MPAFAVHALLYDSAGSILLVRRKESILWGLPGGEVRGHENLVEMLVTLCARQIGLRPDFISPFEHFTLAGMRVAVGVEQVVPGRAAPRGKVQAVHWMKGGAGPGEFEPTARLAIALFKTKARIMPQASGAGLPELVTFRNSPLGVKT
jgi:ADP-ribose pyrophosphatase YjhB (NUDIX family)